MAENNNLIPTDPDWDGTPMSRSEEILYSIIHTEEWDGTPMSRGEYFLVQLKDAIENISMMDIKGTVPTVADLPSTGNKKGDVYSVGPEEQLNKPEYYWDGTSWQYLGQIVDLSGYLPLTGGTMSGALVFNDDDAYLSLDINDNRDIPAKIQSSSSTEIRAADLKFTVTGDGITSIGNSAFQRYEAFRFDDNSKATTLNGDVTTVKGNTSLTLKGHTANNTDTNTIALSSTGISETTSKSVSIAGTEGVSVSSAANVSVSSAAKVSVSGAGGSLVSNTTGLILNANQELDLYSSNGPTRIYTTNGNCEINHYGGTGNMSINAANAPININAQHNTVYVNGYGNVETTAQNGNVVSTAFGNATINAQNGNASILGKTGVSLTASTSGNTTGYVTATHGATVPASDSTNKVATTAMAHNIANSKIGTVPFGTCSSAANEAAKTVTVTNFPGLVDGATIMVLFENTNYATNPTLNVNNSGAQRIMITTSTPVGPNQSSSWAFGGSLVSLMYVQNIGWMLTDFTIYALVSQNNTTADGDYRVLISNAASDGVAGVNKSGNLTFNPSTKRLIVTDGYFYTDNTTIDRDGPLPSSNISSNVIGARDKDGELIGLLSTQIDTEGSVSMQMASYAETANGSEVINSLRIISKKDGSTAFDINGVPVYISTTQPTGNIPIGAIGLGW